MIISAVSSARGLRHRTGVPQQVHAENGGVAPRRGTLVKAAMIRHRRTPVWRPSAVWHSLLVSGVEPEGHALDRWDHALPQSLYGLLVRAVPRAASCVAACVGSLP